MMAATSRESAPGEIVLQRFQSSSALIWQSADARHPPQDLQHG